MKKSLLAAAITLAAAPAFAEIDPIVIVGDRYESPLSGSTQSITVISANEIAESGARSVAEALKLTAKIGIFDSQGNGSNATVSLRGFANDAAQNITILIDGQPVNFATKEGGRLDLVNIEQIERIEVMSGSAGVLYGNGSIAGTINIVTRDSAFDYDQVDLVAGSYGEGIATITGSRAKEDSTFAYSYSTLTRDGYRNYTERKKDQLNLSFTQKNGRVKSQTRLTGSLERRSTQGTTSESTLNTDRRSGGALDRYVYDRFGISQAWTIDEDNNPLTLSLSHQTSDQQIAGASAGFVDTRRNDIRLTKAFDSLQTTALVGFDSADQSYEGTWSGFVHRMDNQSVFARGTFEVSTRLSLTGGARYENAEIAEASADRKFENTALELGLIQVIDESTRLKARLDTHYRLPTLDEIDDYPSITDQTGRSAEVSLEHQTNVGSISLNGFWIKNKDEISYKYNPGFGGYWETTNLDESIRKGLSVGYKTILRNSVALNTSVQLLDSEFSDGEIAGNQIPMSSKTTASLGLIAPLADQASIGIQARFESEKAIYDDYNNDSPKLPSFAEFDLTYNRELSSTTDLQMSIINITDKQRFTYGVRSAGSEYYVPNEGRIIRLGLTHRF